MSAPTVPPRAFVLLIILTLLWGTNWPLFPLAMQEISVWTFRTISVFLGGFALLGLARLRGLSLRIPPKDRRTVLLSALCYLVVWNVASAWAATVIASGQAAVLAFTMPLWVALISWLFLGDRPAGRIMLAIALGATAVVLLMVPSLSAYADAPAGFAAGLFAAFGWAVGTIILKRGQVSMPALVMTGWQLVICGIPITLFAIVFAEGEWFMPTWQSIVVIAYIALIPMSLGTWTWFSIVNLLPANIASLSSIMVPIVAMISGAVVHGEPLGMLQWLAMICSATALALALIKPAAAKT
ncbi:MAG: DMT family transporter [Burkholderiaceae bacterium]